MIEETPEFDTYDARRRVRMIITGIVGLSALVLMVMLILPQLNTGQEDFENIPDEGLLAQKAATNRKAVGKDDEAERQARTLFENARQLAKNGKPNDAVAMLKKVVVAYPKTKVAQQAQEAMARPNQNPPLPLFLDESKATVIATQATGAGTPAVGTAEALGPRVSAVDAARPGAVPSGAGDAQLHLPRNPDEVARVGNPGETAPPPGTTVQVNNLPPGFHMLDGSGVHPSGWPLRIAADRDGAPMVFIPAGSFRMGRDDGPAEEAPSHMVKLGPYYIDQHEVTVRQYNLYLKETGQKPVSTSSLKREGTAAEFTSDHPIVLVSAREAVNCLEWAGKRLPTEAQWEKAARTTDGRMFPWGNSEPTFVRPRLWKQIDRVLTYDLDQSPYGVFDLSGNAWEWTADYYDPTYFRQFRDTTAVNPLGPPARGRSPQLVIKGGSKTWNVTWREALKSETRYPFLGFRGVLVVEDTGVDAAATAPPASPTPGPSVAAPGASPAVAPGPGRPSPKAPPRNRGTRPGAVPF